MILMKFTVGSSNAAKRGCKCSPRALESLRGGEEGRRRRAGEDQRRRGEESMRGGEKKKEGGREQSEAHVIKAGECHIRCA